MVILIIIVASTDKMNEHSPPGDTIRTCLLTTNVAFDRPWAFATYKEDL